MPCGTNDDSSPSLCGSDRPRQTGTYTLAVAVEDAAFGWRSEGDGHFQGPDRQVALHPVADGPADHAPGIQVEDDSQI